MVFATLAFSASAQCPIRGDVNGDGKVTISDVTSLVDIILNGDTKLEVCCDYVEMHVYDDSSVEITSGSGEYSVVCSDPEVVEVSLSDNVIYFSALKAGDVTVTVTDYQTGRTAEIYVVIYEEFVLDMDGGDVNLAIGQDYAIEVVSGSGNYDFESSDPEVADASFDGTSVVVTGLGVGSATITVYDNEWQGTAYINVTVYDIFEVDCSELTVFKGGSDCVNIISGSGNYQVEYYNEEDMEVAVSDSSICISDISGAGGSVSVTDTMTGQSVSINLNVVEDPNGDDPIGGDHSDDAN